MTKTLGHGVRRLIGSVDMVTACLSVLALSVGVNLVQAQRVRDLTGRQPVPDAIVGTRLPTIDVTTPEAARITLPFSGDGMSSVIYFYSESCGWCQRNLPSAVALREAVRGRFRFVALTAESASRGGRALPHHALEADVTGAISAATQRALRLGGTPHTIVVSPDGTVLRSWKGAYRGLVERDVQDYFRISLPGVAATPPRGD
jgi:hypothetical protein